MGGERVPPDPPDSFSHREIYERYFDRVFAFLCGRLDHRDSALDLTQEVFLQFIRTDPRPSQVRGTVAAYLGGIARNVLARYWSRSADLHVQPLDAIADIPRRFTDPWIDRIALERCIERLKLIDQQILDRHFVLGANHKEIAADLGLGHGQVRQRFSRALHQLADCLEEGGSG